MDDEIQRRMLLEEIAYMSLAGEVELISTGSVNVSDSHL